MGGPGGRGVESIKPTKTEMASRIALVTGANQGIGFHIVKELCKKFDGKVLLGARSVQRGEEAKERLESEGLRPSVLEIDVNSKESIQRARDTVKEKYGRVDVLINNAGILIRNPEVDFQTNAAETIKTNYYGVLNVTKVFAPLLQPDSRVINISSMVGKISGISAERKRQILDPSLTMEKLSAIMDEFVSDSKLENYGTKGWPPAGEDYTTYKVSKIGVNRLTELLVDYLRDVPGLLINAVHPGWVKTNLSGSRAPLSVEEGADTPVYLALLPPGTTEPNGKYVTKRTVENWKE